MREVKLEDDLYQEMNLYWINYSFDFLFIPMDTPQFT